MLEISIIIGWILLGIPASFIWYNYFQQKFAIIAKENKRADFINAMIISMAGPVGLFVVIVTGQLNYVFLYHTKYKYENLRNTLKDL